MEKLTKEDIRKLSEEELNALLRKRFGLLIDHFRPELSESEKEEMINKIMNLVEKVIEDEKKL